MTFGVSSACFYPKPTEQAVELLGKAGIHQIEIFYNSFSELEQPFTYRLKELLRRYDMEVKSVHPFSSSFEPYMFFTDYERRFQDILEFYKQCYDCMNQLGAEILVFHGDRKDSFFPEEQYFERFFRLTEQAASYGITVAQENVARCRSHSTLFLKRMCQALPNASFVLDIKQAVRSRQDPFELVELFGKRLVHVHASDHNSEMDCLPIGQGNFDYVRFFQTLKSVEYNNSLILELYRNNFRDIDDLILSIKQMEIYYK